MKPFIAMADQPGKPSPGQRPSKSVSGAFFPWQDFSVTRGLTSTVSLFCQFMVGFIVSLKVALLASGPAQDGGPGWTLTIRVWPAFFLIIGHIVMTAYVLWVACLNAGKSTGLRWDPITIADYCALFAGCNVAGYFSALELLHNRTAKHVLSTNHLFRLGYWKKETPRSRESIVYGIGTTYSAAELTLDIYKPSLYEQMMGYNNAPSPVDDCGNYRNTNLPAPCNQGSWPSCEHYPYRHSPGCGKGWIVFAWLLVATALGLAIFGLINGVVFQGFPLPKDWSLPSNMSVSAGHHTIELPPIDPTDPESQLVAYALVFRSAPVYVAGLFTGTIVEWVDLNMRFMQPFINMFGEAGKAGNAADTVLLAYITTSPLQVPITAIDKGHYRVAAFSTLNTLSPLFPIFIGGLLTLTDERETNTVMFNFSLSAYVGIMVFLSAWFIAIPFAYPIQKRLLPRQFYSMADLMAMCHKSTFLQRPYLDLADQRRTPSKDIMEARILLSGDRFMFGHYADDEDKKHIGFDIHSTIDFETGSIKDTRLVETVTPEGEIKMIISQAARRATTLFGDPTGSQTSTNRFIAWLRRMLHKQRRARAETEMRAMRPVASATGSSLEEQRDVRQRVPVALASLGGRAT
ncbi:hypothetical protein A1O7_02703 [Cladophialophora yegresii CBS 114405]|uniref:Uncharacterized protein n=1 Tax=Cladophialophora yegresii CBS 114405 TaxID=1182544 RepID=W9WB95_9EURO|nr:uncharacterized protein A1O7_02703 [Cladophialophora yegresii CBS 114405]EXJ62270.1 hypothetical protein A1O7_02703 [Cladophialophora yegresii CBS 114405]